MIKVKSIINRQGLNPCRFTTNVYYSKFRILKTINIKFQLLILFLTPLKMLPAQLNVGDKAPSFNFNEIYNSSLSADETKKLFNGKITIVDFWAVWCKPCVEKLPYYEKIFSGYDSNEVQFIAITDDPQENLLNFLKKSGVKVLIGRDELKKDFKNYNVQSLPSIFAINKQGKIVYKGLSISKEIIEEIIKNGSLKQRKDQKPNSSSAKQLIKYGGFSPGQDPLINQILRDNGFSNKERPSLISQFVIRHSFESKFSGSGHRRTSEGYVGITYIGVVLDDLLLFLLDVPSKNWLIIPQDIDSGLLDLIYWKQAGTIDDAKKEILNELKKINNIDIIPTKIERIVTTVKAKDNDFLKNRSEIPEGTINLYTPLTLLINQLNLKSNEFFTLDSIYTDKYLYSNNLSYQELHEMSPEEIKDLFSSMNLILVEEKQYITLFTVRQ